MFARMLRFLDCFEHKMTQMVWMCVQANCPNKKVLWFIWASLDSFDTVMHGLDRWTLKCHRQLPTWTWTCYAINNNFPIRKLLLCFLTWLAARKCLCLGMWQRIVYRSIKWAKSTSVSSLIHSVGTCVSKQRKACPLVACRTTSKTNSISEIHKCLLQKPRLSVHLK